MTNRLQSLPLTLGSLWFGDPLWTRLPLVHGHTTSRLPQALEVAYPQLVALSETEIRSLIAKGEDHQTEFKSNIPKPLMLAKLIGGMANATGGRIILGVGGPPFDESLPGVDPDRAVAMTRQALDLLEPQPQVGVFNVSVDGKHLVEIEIASAAIAPVLVSGVPYVREGAITVRANANQVLARIGPHYSTVELRQTLEGFGLAIERQGLIIERLEADAGWRLKLLWAFIGAVLGTLFGLIPLLFR